MAFKLTGIGLPDVHLIGNGRQILADIGLASPLAPEHAGNPDQRLY